MSDDLKDVRSYRLSSIDAIRGLAIVVMALDHVRDFFFAGAVPDPMTDPDISIGLFATRWITHFCAPVFVLLAGVSAGLMLTRKSKGQLSRFLVTRGLWFIAVEWFVISMAFTFSPLGSAEIDGKVAVFFQVIWAIGASMVALSVAQLLGRKWCCLFGLMILCCHNLLDPVWPESEITEQTWPLWVTLHSQMAFPLGPFVVFFQYPLLPWIGVMFTGFGLSSVFEWGAESRKKVLFRLGVLLTLLFIGLRCVGVYGDPHSWFIHDGNTVRTWIGFLDTTKYPPSLQFLLMTLGPAAIACSVAERLPGRVLKQLTSFGRAPFAFYVAHLYLIHVLSLMLGLFQGFDASSFMTHFLFFPEGYGLNLPGMYVVWLVVLVALFPFCRYVADLKSRRRDWWLSYL